MPDDSVPLSSKTHYSFVLIACLISVGAANYVVGRIQAARPTSRMRAVETVPSSEVICVGSSHFQRAIDSRQYAIRLANLNHPGLNYQYAEQVIRSQLERAKSVRALVLELGCTPLYRNTTDSPTLAIWQLKSSPAIIKQAPLKLAGQFVPLLRSPKPTPSSILQLLTTKSRIDENPGYEASDLIMSASGSDRAAYHNTLYFEENGDDNIVAFWRIHELCSRMDIQVVLLKLPYASGYYDNLKPALVAGLTKFRRTIDEFNKDSRDTIRIVDCSTEKWNREDFRDGDHVNQTGAKKVNAILKSALERQISR